MEEKRKVLFTCGMSSDKMLIITDAPKEDIEKWCYRYNESLENGTYGKDVELFDTLKAADYYVRILHDTELENNTDDIDVIGYDEEYELTDYMGED